MSTYLINKGTGIMISDDMSIDERAYGIILKIDDDGSIIDIRSDKEEMFKLADLIVDTKVALSRHDFFRVLDSLYYRCDKNREKLAEEIALYTLKKYANKHNTNILSIINNFHLEGNLLIRLRYKLTEDIKYEELTRQKDKVKYLYFIGRAEGVKILEDYGIHPKLASRLINSIPAVPYSIPRSKNIKEFIIEQITNYSFGTLKEITNLDKYEIMEQVKIISSLPGNLDSDGYYYSNFKTLSRIKGLIKFLKDTDMVFYIIAEDIAKSKNSLSIKYKLRAYNDLHACNNIINIMEPLNKQLNRIMKEQRDDIKVFKKEYTNFTL